MKNFLFNNYNINVDKIYNNKDILFFYIGNEKIYIVKNKEDTKKIDSLYRLTNEMYNNGIMVNTFILNNRNEPFTKRNNYCIALLKVNNRINDIRIGDFNSYNNIHNNLNYFDIMDNWKNEIDTIEKEIIEYNNEYKIIQDSLDYFIGLGENAISLIYEIKDRIEYISTSIGHNVTYELFDKCNLGDPFTFIRVNRMYDISNYIKYKFYKNEIDYDEIINYIVDINDFEKIYLFSCLLYPNIYFDLVKQVLLEKENENKLNCYINRIKEYEKLLVFFKNEFKSVNIINLINWISD